MWILLDSMLVQYALILPNFAPILKINNKIFASIITTNTQKTETVANTKTS
jgi:hypothetical protein